MNFKIFNSRTIKNNEISQLSTKISRWYIYKLNKIHSSIGFCKQFLQIMIYTVKSTLLCKMSVIQLYIWHKTSNRAVILCLQTGMLLVILVCNWNESVYVAGTLTYIVHTDRTTDKRDNSFVICYRCDFCNSEFWPHQWIHNIIYNSEISTSLSLHKSNHYLIFTLQLWVWHCHDGTAYTNISNVHATD